ncbi:MAG TPA: hypothetical protein VFZ17_05735 [Acidimicrobiia bacterium]|nr:hypothetical protein [Acidimicrobiia bacterium]
MTPASPRRMWAALELLDHQIVDCDGRLAGKVDDLELDVPSDGELPVVTEILSGLGALAGQIGGAAGSWLASIEARIAGRDRPPIGRIMFSVVTTVAEHVEVSVSRQALDSNRAEIWTRDVIVDQIPGARHEAD